MSTLHYFQRNFSEQSDDRSQVSSGLTESIVRFMAPITQLLLGAGFAWLIIAVDTAATPKLGALAAVVAILYVASLSDNHSVAGLLAMAVPSISIWALLLSDLHNINTIGFALLIHVATSFFGSITKPEGTISELGYLWTGLLGFNSTLLLYWAVSF